MDDVNQIIITGWLNNATRAIEHARYALEIGDDIALTQHLGNVLQAAEKARAACPEATDQ